MTIVAILLASMFMYASFRQPPVLPATLKIRHFLAIVAVIVLTTPYLRTVSFAARHPERILDTYYVSQGGAPAWLSFMLLVLSVAFGNIVWLSATSMAARKARGRKAFLWAWPPLVAVMLAQILLTSIDHVAERGIGFIAIACFLLVVIVMSLALSIDWHFRSTRTDLLFVTHEQEKQQA